MMRAEEPDGAKLGDLHIRTLSVNSIAGSLSLTYMLGNLLYRFVTDEPGVHGGAPNRSRARPQAVEESLRYEAPVLFLFRTAKDDTELGGCPVHAGRAHHHRDRLRRTATRRSTNTPTSTGSTGPRLPDDHLSFGEGPHLCLGNHLTRMIGRVVLEEALGTFASGQLRLADGYELSLVPMFLEYGPESLDVVVGPAS